MKRNGRDALDDAGKLVLALVLMFLGILAEDVVIDTAQAGGACSNADGFLTKPRIFFEVKGSIAKKRIDRIQGPNARPQFTLSSLRFGRTWWYELVIIGRERNPKDWTNVAEYAACGFWIGIVSRRRCEEALKNLARRRSKSTRRCTRWRFRRGQLIIHRRGAGIGSAHASSGSLSASC